ncbi:hypothetical protein HMPREF9093_00805, partial [Fusobacterium sp. oral taxon 370 str. F0437]
MLNSSKNENRNQNRIKFKKIFIFFIEKEKNCYKLMIKIINL